MNVQTVYEPSVVCVPPLIDEVGVGVTLDGVIEGVVLMEGVGEGEAIGFGNIAYSTNDSSIDVKIGMAELELKIITYWLDSLT